MAIYNPYYQSPSYNGTGTYPLSYQNIPDNIVTADKLESFIQNYLDTHSYRPYIPRSERNKNE